MALNLNSVCVSCKYAYLSVFTDKYYPAWLKILRPEAWVDKDITNCGGLSCLFMAWIQTFQFIFDLV